MDLRRAALVLLLGSFLAPGPAVRAEGAGGGPAGGLGGNPAPPANDSKALLFVRINQAIDSGVRWLMDADRKQKSLVMAPGNWSDRITGNRLYDPNAKGAIWCDPTGCTSLSLYALLKSGVPKDDPVVKKAFQWLKTGRANAVVQGTYVVPNEVPSGNYEIAALVLALEARANPHKREAEREHDLKFKLKKGEKLKLDVKLDPEDQVWMKKLLDALVKRQNKGAAWRYGYLAQGGALDNGVRGVNDLSASQLVMLALLAGERCGFKQPDQIYLDPLQWTLGMQEKDGPEMRRWDPSVKEDDSRYAPQKDHARGFSYLPEGGNNEERRATGAMTCCGLANIVICTSILEARESKLLTPALHAQAEKAWWDGVAWMDANWSVSNNTNSSGYHYYYLYCMERACDLKRINLLAGHPWYNLGAKVLVDEQLNANTGAWTKVDGKQPCDVLDTCFALLFLNRATPAITTGD
jgi:hypothetical protein